MNRYPITVAGLKRSLPICPVNETLSIGAFVIFGDAPLTQACAAALLENGADALVCGFLTPDGELDGPRMERLVFLAHSAGRKFTLHRAFDVCRDPFSALERCKEWGVDTILTSGQAPSCLEGASSAPMV